ncbi:MAG: serine/threonine-protein kinase [Pirellulales bacterium]
MASDVPTQARAGWEGRSLGEYQIGKLLGAGGNGLVHLAVHRWLERTVAIKFLNDIQAGDAQAVDRFRREAQVAANLIHPGIVRATDGGTIGNQVFLVTDYVDGLDLSSVVQHFQRSCPDSIALPVAEACQIGIQAAEALQFISSKGIVHRDIKPSNIMLDHSGEIRILDLGLARTQQHGHTMTATGQVMGTIDYMAPEQASDPRRVSHLADIYSLGCTLYFLLVGRPPLDTSSQETLAAKLMATLDREPTAINVFRKDVPAKLENLILRMMEKDPANRPQSFAQISKELQAFGATASLAGLLTGSPAQLQQNTMKKSDSIVDQLADYIERAGMYAMLMMGVFFGFVEADPIVRPGQRKRYRFSTRWLKPFGIIAFLIFLVWATGIRFEPAPDIH